MQRSDENVDVEVFGAKGRTPRRVTPLPESRASARRREKISLESSSMGGLTGGRESFDGVEGSRKRKRENRKI